MSKKLVIILTICLLLFGMATRKELENVKKEAEVGVYIKGYYSSFNNLLHRYGISSTPIFYNLQQLTDQDFELYDALDLIVFTTRGLSGVHSEIIKNNLEVFVENGGSLLVLCQKYGYDYSVLPGNIDGYGWEEDEKHRKRWAYINEEHPIFSGQDDIILKCFIDGYITVYPYFSEVLLLRSENLMPALISYNYGAGNVIVTSLYPDYGLESGRITEDELILFRDLLTWAMNPDLRFQYVKPDSHIVFPIEIENFSDTVLYVERLKLKVYTPNRKLYRTEEIKISTKLQKNYPITKHWETEKIPDIKGIWMINYLLLGSTGCILQGEKTGAIFAPENDIRLGKMKLGDLKMRVFYENKLNKDSLSILNLSLTNKSDSAFKGMVMVTDKSSDRIIDSISPVILEPYDNVNLKFPLTPEIVKMEGLFFLLYGEDQKMKTGEAALSKFWFCLNAPADFKKEHYYIDINDIQDTITKSVQVPQKNYEMYIDEFKTDKNEYTLGDTIQIKVKIHTDSDSRIKFIVSSRSPISDTFFIKVSGESDNRFEVKYPTSGMKRGQNGISLSLNSDSKMISGEYLLISLNVPDTISPVIDIVETPENTHASNRFSILRARILNPGDDPTSLCDTLYYRIASSGGGYWQTRQVHYKRGDTNKYLIPSQPNGTHIQCHLVARDLMGNIDRFPSKGEINYWVLPTLRAYIKEININKDATITIKWTPPKQSLYSHCYLTSDTIYLGENKIAERFIPQYIPAILNEVSINFVCGIEENIKLKVQAVDDSLPGRIIYTSNCNVKNGENDLKIPAVEVPSEGLFISVEGSANTGVVFDGFGQGLYTAVYNNAKWDFDTPGEALIGVSVKYKPSRDSSRMEGLQSKVLPFEVYRKSVDSEWTKISGEVYDTAYTDTSAKYNKEYFYKINCTYSNPPDSIFSPEKSISLDK